MPIAALLLALGPEPLGVDSEPSYPADLNTLKSCNDWFDNSEIYPCFAMPSIAEITKEPFSNG